jgi:hypothetical protein
MASTISELRILLYRIQQKLVAHPIFTRGAGVPVDDPARVRELEELDKMSLQLSLIARELKNKSHLLAARETNLRKLPHEDRYLAAASIRGQQSEIADVLKLAGEIQKLLEDLLRRSGLIGEGELADGLGKFIEKLYHQAHTHGEVHNMPDGLAYASPAKGEFGGSIESVTILVFVALRAVVYAAKRAAKNQSIES